MFVLNLLPSIIIVLWKIGCCYFIEARNLELQRLNQDFGFIDEDGTVPIGCKSSVIIDYKQQYDNIEAGHRVKYDAVTPDRESWMRQCDISLFEYLLLDNCSGKELDSLAGKLTPEDELSDNAIVQKAIGYMAGWKSQYRIGGVQSAMQREIEDYKFVAARCRNFFDIRIWNISKQIKIFRYGKLWSSALNRCFQNLTAPKFINFSAAAKRLSAFGHHLFFNLAAGWFSFAPIPAPDLNGQR